LNEYLHHQRDSLADFRQAILASMPLPLKTLRALALRLPFMRRWMEGVLYRWQRRMVETHPNSPYFWVKSGNLWRIRAFFKSMEDFLAIPNWNTALDDAPPADYRRLSHGYDEQKPHLTAADLHGAAAFRGGALLSTDWQEDCYQPLGWRCAFGHEFTARPYSVLKAGHWCPTCTAHWNGDQQARRNPFFAQVWYADHDPQEDYAYPLENIRDVEAAHLPARKRKQKAGLRPASPQS